MFGAHNLGHVLDLSSGMCSRLRLEGVPRAYGVEHLSVAILFQLYDCFDIVFAAGDVDGC